MNRRMTRISAAVFAAIALGSVAAGGAMAHRSDLEAARAATGRFHSLRQAEAAGYARPPAPAPLHECISSFDGTGAMGFHYINGALLDMTLDAAEPEVLVYAPDRHGRLKLVALEYVVFQAPWKAAHGDQLPMLFGQMFMATGEPNRFDIPAFYSLHVWLWKHNPAGMFAPFNPRVSCDGRRPSHDHGDDDAISRLSASGAAVADRKPQYSCQTAAATA
jgi:hypothetical protein